MPLLAGVSLLAELPADSTAPSPSASSETPASNGEGACASGASATVESPAIEGLKVPSDRKDRHRKVGEVSNKFQDELSSGGNIYDVLGEAADDEVTDAPPKTVNVPITEPVRTLRRKMNLALGDAPSVGSNCAVRSVERSKANTPWADNITDQKAATIQ